jgi:LysR family glycine cleavage system transcriptional activator
MPVSAQLLAFESTARHLSVSRAAQELHLTQSAVSRQLQQLEEHLGVALFHRQRQRMSLTDAGRSYASEVRAGLSALTDATQKVMSYGGSRDVLNLAVLPTFGTRWLIPRMPRFEASRPDIIVHFAARTEPFDFQHEPFDAAIHFGDPVWPATRCDHLLDEHVVAVCSPGYRRKHGISHPRDLAGKCLLQQVTRPTLWLEWLEHAGLNTANGLQGPHYEQFSMMAAAAAAGTGIALVPRFLIEDELATGRLTVLFDDMAVQTQAYYLVVPETRAAEPLIEAFRQWLLGEARQTCATTPRDTHRSSEPLQKNAQPDLTS